MEFVPKARVYHGSPMEFGRAIPKENRRLRRLKSGETIVIFHETSFHATPHRWIALAYTYDGNQVFEVDGKEVHYNMGVDLYGEDKEIAVYGARSLEGSLDKLYGKGGYVYHYDAEQFFYTEGLGNREVITKDEVDSIEAEHILDPVAELRKEGVSFKFIDLTLPENRKYLD